MTEAGATQSVHPKNGFTGQKKPAATVLRAGMPVMRIPLAPAPLPPCVNVSYIHVGSLMSGTANQYGYGNPGMGAGPWGQGPYGNAPGPAPWEHPEWGYRQWLWASKPLWIVATVLGFIFFWPIGLVLLFLMIGAKRMGCFGYGGGCGWGRHGSWQGYGAPQDNGAPPPWAAWKNFWTGGGPRPGAQPASPPSSGNHAFDEYRAETLRRLEDEQKEFASFLERLRFAKDKAEFDQFIAERRSGPPAPPPIDPTPHA